MSRSRRFLSVSAVVTAIVVVALGIHLGLRGAEGASEGSELDDTLAEIATTAAGAFATDITIPVEGVPAQRTTLVLGVNAAGQAEASRRTVVTAQVGGRVMSLPARENAAVGANQVLAVLDPAEYDLAVREAESNLNDAEARFREMTLFDDRIADPETRAERERLARSRSGLNQAEISLERARLDLARTRVPSPIGGRIADLQVVPGQWVRPGDELMTIVALDPLRVEVQVLEGDVGHLTPGRGARVTFAAFPGEVFQGRIESINPVVEAGTRTARVSVAVANPEGRILPGMYARVSLEARDFADRVLVPRSAILERDRRTMLFVYDGDERAGRAKWRYVTTGLANDSMVEILEDAETEAVAPGEIVLVGGHHTLIHDARVHLVEDVAAAGGRPN